MDDVKRAKRVLRVAAVVLFGALAAGGVMSGQDQGQRLPGLGSGIVPVKVEDGVRVARLGEWKVSVPGGVEMAPVMPPILAVNRSYLVSWDGGTTETIVVRELHASGWVRVDERGKDRWVNLTRAVSIVRHGS